MSVNMNTMNIYVYVDEVKKSDDFPTTIFGENGKCKKCEREERRVLFLFIFSLNFCHHF